MVKTQYIRTDLAKEAGECADITNKRGISYKEHRVFDIDISDMKITTEEGSAIIGKPMGRYITVECGKTWLMDDKKREKSCEVISQYIRELMPEGDKTVLVVGLGNRNITPDALGPICTDSLIVTRHIKDYDKELFEKLGQEEIAAIAPGVVGQTGVETLELIRGCVERVKPDVMIALDALAARSVDRLATTVQLSDAGIAPGSGIGNKRKEITKNTVGVPVIAIGVPTVVDSSTLVYDALSRAGIEEVDPTLEKVLENGRSFFVSLKESDVAIEESAKLISDALNRAFCRG